MHRAAKWKVEKNKVKVVFRLQLHATQVPQPGWDKLFVSLIPVETGKATAKTTKVSVRNGSCKWSDPIYETTRLLQDAKTRKFDEKLFKLVVSMGSSRYGYLGEASINLADFAEVVKPSSVSLPLQSCSFGTTLHVTVQPLTAKTGFREFEQQREITERGIRISQTVDDEPDGNALATEEKVYGDDVKDMSPVTSAIHLSSDGLDTSSKQPSNEANGNYRGYVVDDVLSPSDPRQEVPDTLEIDSKKDGIHQDAVRFLSAPSQICKPPESINSIGQQLACSRQTARSSGEWKYGWSSDHSTDNDAVNVYEENERLRANLQTAESSIMQLKTEVASLERQAERQAAEIETLTRQLATEIKQGQDFASKISDLKFECDRVKSESEQLKSLGHSNEKHPDAGNGWFDMGNAGHVLKDLEELDSENQVDINLNLQLEKSQKACTELLLSVEGDSLEKKTRDTEHTSNRRLDISAIEEENETLKDVKLDWLQKLSSSEDKIREIKEKIFLKDDGRISMFLQDDLEVLERVFQEFRQENISMISKLIGEIVARNKKNIDHNPDKQSLPGDFCFPRNIITNGEINGRRDRKLELHLDKVETQNCNQPYKSNYLDGSQAVHDTQLWLDRVPFNLKSRDQNLGKTGKINGLDITRVGLQFSDDECEVRALSSSNHHPETRFGNLEEKLIVDDYFNRVIRDPDGGSFEEMPTLRENTNSVSAIGMSTNIENDHEDVHSKLFQLEEKNNWLLKRISQLEAQLRNYIEKDEVHLSEDLSEKVRKSECRINSGLELEERIFELSAEAEDYKRAWDSLSKEKEQLEYEYEALIHELEERASYLEFSEKQLQEQLHSLRDEHAVSLCSISTLESKVEKLQREFDEQEARFAADRNDMVLSKTELEQRANRAEAAWKKTRWNNACIVEQLQKELERLSLQISSTFDANEKLATQAFAEASQLHIQKNELLDQLSFMQESLRKADAEIALIRKQCDEKVQELLMQLNMSKKHEEELLSKLQNTSNELENRLENETNYITRDEEVSLKILMLEREIQTLMNEKSYLTQKVEESNIIRAELESCKINLDGYKIERNGLEASLQRVGQEKIKLEEDLSSLKETLRNSDADVDKLKCCKDELERTVASLQFTLEDKLTELSSHYEQMNAVMELRSRPSELEQRLLEQESKTQDMKQLIVLQKDLQQKAEAEASQLRAEKDNLEQHLSGLQELIQSANADITYIKRECEDKVQELITQLDLSNKRQDALLSRLQTARSDNEKLMNNETNCIQRNQELCSKISELEREIQALMNEKNYLVQKVEESNIIKSELESCKITLDGYKIERTGLEVFLQRVRQEKNKLDDELSSLKETLKNSDADVDRLKCCKDKLEKTVASLQFTLDEKLSELSSHYEQKNELTELQNRHSELEQKLLEQELKTEDMKHLLVLQKELQQKAEEEASQLRAEKNNLDEYSSGLQESLESANAEIAFIKRESENKVQEFMTQLDRSNMQQEALLSRLQIARSDNEKLMNNEMNYIQRKQELCSKISELETEIQTVLKDKNRLIERIKECDSVKAEFEICKMVLESSKVEKAQLKVSLHRVNQEKCKLEDELHSLKAVLENSDRELGDLKCSRDELEITVTFLKSKLDDQHAQISFCNDQRDELIQLRRQLSELKHMFLEEESKTEDLSQHLFHSKELLQQANAEVSELHARKDDLEECLSVTQESLQRANADTAFMREQFEVKVQELALSTKQRQELLTRLENAMSELEIRTKDEAKYLRLNEELSVKLAKLETEVETHSNVENDILHKVEEYDAVKAEIQNIKKRLDICNAEKAELEVSLDGAIQEKQKLDEDLSSVKEMLRNSDSELDELKCCKNELEIRVAFLQSKMDEQNNEFMQLLSEHNKLKHCLSEQEVKTEELKMNLTQLKDLQQKAEADAYQLRVKKKELEHQSTMKQESLRIALIREQYESKEQDFAKQLELLNQHREELLLKLQDTLKDLEMRTKSETHYMKKAEEFSAKTLLLETEVQSVLDEKNGLVKQLKDYESVKAELENHKTSLECWKAEKEELEYLLRRANVQKGQLDTELCSLKEILKYSDVELDELKCCKDELEMTIASLQSKLNSQTAELMQLQEQHFELKNRLLEQEWKIENLMNVKAHLEKELQEKADALVETERKLKEQDENSQVSAGDSPLGQHSKLNSKAGHLLDISSHNEKELVDLKEKVKLLEGELKSKTIALEASQKEFAGNENKSFNDIENVEIIDESLKEESLNSSMDRLHKELEKMKNENLAPFQQENDHMYELDAQDPLQKEVQQLQMANEQLESMFPSFIEPSKGGNAIERVLALETELADALKANNTQKRQFQSSFVKQQADQAAMLQSFRDINELINDMLELKRKNSVLDDELKEMQRRYSQISLQFAEVEGERQQLVMTIKSMRVGKKS